MLSRWLDKIANRSARAVDRGALRLMTRTMTGGAKRPPFPRARERLLEVIEHYGTEEMLGSPGTLFAERPAALVTQTPLPGRRGFELRAPSLYTPSFPGYAEELAGYQANQTVHARWLRAADRPRPVAILIHGWGAGHFFFEERAFAVSYWLRLGVDVCMVQLPFHGKRQPAQGKGRGSLFPSTHVVRTNEAFGQAIGDLRCIAEHLRQSGAPAVGVMGMSLGAYTAALWTTLDQDLDFAVAMIPAFDLADLMWRHGEGNPMQQQAERQGISGALLGAGFAVHAPHTRATRVPSERLMVVAAKGDYITPPDHAERLAEHWQPASQHWFAGGHLAQLGRGNAFRAVRAHLASLDLVSRSG